MIYIYFLSLNKNETACSHRSHFTKIHENKWLTIQKKMLHIILSAFSLPVGLGRPAACIEGKANSITPTEKNLLETTDNVTRLACQTAIIDAASGVTDLAVSLFKNIEYFYGSTLVYLW